MKKKSETEIEPPPEQWVVELYSHAFNWKATHGLTEDAIDALDRDSMRDSLDLVGSGVSIDTVVALLNEDRNRPTPIRTGAKKLHELRLQRHRKTLDASEHIRAKVHAAHASHDMDASLKAREHLQAAGSFDPVTLCQELNALFISEKSIEKKKRCFLAVLEIEASLHRGCHPAAEIKAGAVALMSEETAKICYLGALGTANQIRKRFGDRVVEAWLRS